MHIIEGACARKSLSWNKAHSESEPNEYVDQIAKQAVNKKCIDVQLPVLYWVRYI